MSVSMTLSDPNPGFKVTAVIYILTSLRDKVTIAHL